MPKDEKVNVAANNPVKILSDSTYIGSIIIFKFKNINK